MFRNIPTVTKNLLIINVLAFIAMLLLERRGVDLAGIGGLHFFLASDFRLWQLVTYLFLHANLSHIFFNMFALWMFGCVIENVWGPRKFLFYYILCGVGAGLIQELAQLASFYLIPVCVRAERMDNHRRIRCRLCHPAGLRHDISQ